MELNEDISQSAQLPPAGAGTGQVTLSSREWGLSSSEGVKLGRASQLKVAFKSFQRSRCDFGLNIWNGSLSENSQVVIKPC